MTDVIVGDLVRTALRGEAAVTEVVEIPPHASPWRCPKCSHRSHLSDLIVSHHAEAAVSALIGRTVIWWPERLEVTCMVCGFVHLMQPADARAAQAPDVDMAGPEPSEDSQTEGGPCGG